MSGFGHIAAALRESPITAAFEEMAETNDFSRLDGNKARRHHYVPQFVLRGFSAPLAAGRRIYQMPTLSRRAPKAIGIRDAAVREWLYRATDEQGRTTNRHEGYLALIEHYAAPAVQRLTEDPQSLSTADRATIAYHVAFQIMRTPAAAEQVTELANMAMHTAASEVFSDREAFAERYRDEHGALVSDDEIERFRADLLEHVRDGKVRMSGRNGADFASGLEHAATNVPTIFAFDWLLLRAETGRFIVSDRGYAIHDPAPRFPWAAQGLLSSPISETLVPLTSSTALLMRPGNAACTLQVREVSKQQVESYNLRTFGWATGYVFAESQATLDGLRLAARRRPADVIRPKPFCSVIGIELDSDDPSLANENRARGWPPHIAGSDGLPRDYIVIPADRPYPDRHRRADELAEHRARKRLGVGREDKLDGRLVHEPLDPLD